VKEFTLLRSTITIKTTLVRMSIKRYYSAKTYPFMYCIATTTSGESSTGNLSLPDQTFWLLSLQNVVTARLQKIRQTGVAIAICVV
jgi:hypothetical protein